MQHNSFLTYGKGADLVAPFLKFPLTALVQTISGYSPGYTAKAHQRLREIAKEIAKESIVLGGNRSRFGHTAKGASSIVWEN